MKKFIFTIFRGCIRNNSQKTITSNSKQFLFFPLLVSMLFALNSQTDAAEYVMGKDATRRENFIDLTIENGEICADLNKTSLKSVLEKLKEECGLAYIADEQILEREVSVTFESMPLEKGLNKILSQEGYLLEYAEKERPDKLFLFIEQKRESVTSALVKSEEEGLFEDYAPLIVKPLSPYMPQEVARDLFVTNPPDYQLLPKYIQSDEVRVSFMKPPRNYEPLPQGIQNEDLMEQFSVFPPE
ncbi:MAG: hypothetical protein D8M57_17080 [Candidatus Scalindua sp. AMX11]|nr:MAG: hypothetical protein DWQ00_12525 [Candidatus Scalindua sp.]NOG84065.1 hypothetical protein [Planctomycetota bacterium]RZV67433.1 MAG: hypothetical protein EX341_17000 [Candidatus Scalindua sp. SCAELEC01]TDE63684.1 MAG: hypothetical protein D8M57_17080 [Candidatus Scalindua sp. AMX11]GJQ60557.1 MAG: hypothetical protein SCALA701_33580 [Candidatus Scalindua sp.]